MGQNPKIFDVKYSMDISFGLNMKCLNFFSLIVDTTLTSDEYCDYRGDRQNRLSPGYSEYKRRR